MNGGAVRWGGGLVSVGGVLAIPDVRVFKATGVVTGLGVGRGVSLPEICCCVQSNPFLPQIYFSAR